MTEANVQRRKNVDPIIQLQQLYQRITESLVESIPHPALLSTLLTTSSRTDNETTTKDSVIQTIRTNATLRRQVSQYTMIMTSLLQPPSRSKIQTNVQTRTTTTTEATAGLVTLEMKQLYIFFDSIWNDLLRLPSLSLDTTYSFTISLVIPIYQECGKELVRTTLRVALQHCHQPQGIQIIIVDAGQCRNLDSVHDYINQPPSAGHNNRHGHSNWGEIRYVSFASGGGRGPCQNYGAQYARGRYLTFLHSDTLLPYHWDVKVRTTLDRTSHDGTVVTHVCSFSVGHNVSKEGLGTTLRYPYGIRSILLLGNIRAWLFRLPYGDHILSFHTVHFHYIGGFPEQPIMEDYSIMDLLRQRATAVPSVETLRIIPPPTGLCSVRRWQMHGVVYVTLVNALLVHRYAHGGWTADDVFSYYYLRPLKHKTQ